MMVEEGKKRGGREGGRDEDRRKRTLHAGTCLFLSGIYRRRLAYIVRDSQHTGGRGRDTPWRASMHASQACKERA
jgi:hypothetical protein